MKLPQLEPLLLDLPSGAFGSKADLLAKLGRSNEPLAAMVTCWELGCIPNQLSHAKQGEIIVLQNPGGLVPAAGSAVSETELQSILYYLHQPTVQHLIVCGHTHCKTLTALLGNETKGMLDAYRQILEGVSHRFETLYANRPKFEWHQIIAQESVLHQLANLCSHTVILTKLRAGTLFLHGWLRDDETSQVAVFDPVTGQFSI